MAPDRLDAPADTLDARCYRLDGAAYRLDGLLANWNRRRTQPMRSVADRTLLRTGMQPRVTHPQVAVPRLRVECPSDGSADGPAASTYTAAGSTYRDEGSSYNRDGPSYGSDD
jgi:hypothetical protein